MRDMKDTCRIAVVQATPVMFDKDGCLAKALRLIDESADHGAELVVFPELFIPGYPYGMTFGFTVGSRKAPGREDWKRYYDNSLLSDGPEMQQLIAKAAERNVYLSIGYSERDSVTGTLYNANMMIAPDGRAMNHRKLKPTGSERVVWGRRGAGLFPCDGHALGADGQPDLLGELYAPGTGGAVSEGHQPVYLPPQHQRQPGVAEHHPPHRHRGTLLLCQRRSDLPPQRLSRHRQRSGGDRCAAGHRLPGRQLRHRPFGHDVSDTVWDEEAIIYADLDMQKVPASRMELDCVGHYARPDVLELHVHEK